MQRLSPVKTFLGFLKDEGWIENSLAAHLRVPRTRRATTGRRPTQAEGASDQVTLGGEIGYDENVDADSAENAVGESDIAKEKENIISQ